VLAQLARYLLQFHQVHIPSVGTIRLVQRPASLDVASKLIHPPSFTLDFSEDGWLGKHQLWHFSTHLHFDEGATRDALQDAGVQLRRAIEKAPFTWNGIGTFSYYNQEILFEPQQHKPVLQPLPAERVVREGVQHSVLVGDQVVLSNGTRDIEEAVEKSWNWRLIAGWAAVILSLFFILFYLYQHQFQSTASGLQDELVPKPPPATYRQ
jgi:hypothetical protein